MPPKDPNVHKLPFSATSQGSRLGMVLSENHARFVEDELSTPKIINWKTQYHTDQKKTTNDGSSNKKGFRCPRFREYVGNVPLIDLSHLVPNAGVTLYAKCEFLNPSMNGLDRLVKRYVETLANHPTTLVAAGNTHIGVSLVMACAWFGHDCILTVPSTLDESRKNELKAYGATLQEVTVEPGQSEYAACHEAAQMIADASEKHTLADASQLKQQHSLPCDLAQELMEDAEQLRAPFTHYVGSSANPITTYATAEYFQKNNVQFVEAQQEESVLTSDYGDDVSSRKPDQTIPVSMEDTVHMSRFLSSHEGLNLCPAGASNLLAAIRLSKKLPKGSRIVTDLQDIGVRYLGTVFNDEWLKKQGIQPLDNPKSFLTVNRQRIPNKEEGREKVPNYYSTYGDNPMIELTHLAPEAAKRGIRIVAKCEFFNPSFSIKDRIVFNIISKAEESGALKPGMTIIAASSGNTGASTAMVAAMKGYDCIITTSPKCSKEKMDAIRCYGAQLWISPKGAKEGTPQHYMEIARLAALEDEEKYFDVDQYETLSNPEGHYISLGPELYRDTIGAVTHFIAAGSTGGTITGIGRCLKELNPNIKVILADPVGSIFKGYFETKTVGTPGPFLVEGVGKGSIPGAMNFDFVDDCVSISDEAAFRMCKRLARTEGCLPGGSSGLNVAGAIKYANERAPDNAVICTVLPDLGIKYLSKVYNDEYLLQNNIATV
eukprot:CAMPEP_0178924350 /NCGR_PEP_ID=MMETSP0786-20121207/17275_1 /TAXON_ID=186022 /ORGANISM="Thalassionema frauenfeldii, Strain CCMP 1798" /LENGTH=715 /DNA_ID=CAMNT_0020599045 /DNA_START=131 /DNA_END=2278 /DNA_ORIENTATION=+